MRCKYRFKIQGKIRLEANMPIASAGFSFQPETKDGLLTHIAVTVPVPDPSQWPSIQPNPAPGIKAHINATTPMLPLIRQQLRSLQGFLSMFGLRKIEIDNLDIEWLPDNDAERVALPLFQHSESRQDIPDADVKPLPYDLFARSVLAADAAAAIDVSMNFFRRGMVDVYERSYIEAIYDFYFLLETLFADGKFRQDEVIRRFAHSSLLRSCISQVIHDPGRMIRSSLKLMQEFHRTYGHMTVDKIVEKIVALRGYLHHHTQKRRDIWHPDEQIQFELDALVLQSVAFHVVFEVAREYLWDDTVMHTYEEIRLKQYQQP